jgi:AT-rich interactive domain-containing protein 4B
MSDETTDEADVEDTEADVTGRGPDVVDGEGHGVDVDGGGDAGSSAPEASDEVDAELEPEDEPDQQDERREEDAAEQENLDNHRDDEPFQS